MVGKQTMRVDEGGMTLTVGDEREEKNEETDGQEAFCACETLQRDRLRWVKENKPHQ